MISRYAIKANARAQLGNTIFHNNWLMALVMILLSGAVLGLVAASGIGTLLLAGPVSVCLASVFLGLARGRGIIPFEEAAASGFTPAFFRNVLVSFMSGLFIALWSLLLIIPGLIKSYEYSMASYVAYDHPEWDYSMCLRESGRLTNGYKWDLFVLDLSFIGWYIVGALCFGVGTLWVSTYHSAARANYYEALRSVPRA